MAAGVGSLAAAMLPLGPLEPGTDSTLAKAVTQRADDAFAPSKSGFGFRNTFTGSPLPASLRGAGAVKGVAQGIGAGLGLPHEYGLCGGMSLAAADFYLAKKPIPDFTKPPQQGTPLYEYLYKRQADSMGPLGVMALKFWSWMKLPDRSDTGECTQKLTAQELPGIIARLKTRQLVPIGLVLTREGEGRLWENHQILGYGVKEGQNGVVDLLVYDPNFPRDDKVVIRLTPESEEASKSTDHAVSANPADDNAQAKPPAPKATGSQEYQCQRISGKGLTKKVRGLFAMPYEPKTPPEGLGR
jgi:hypothetical protein